MSSHEAVFERPERTLRLSVEQAVALIALLVGIAVVWLSAMAFGGQLSGLVRMAPSDPAAALVSGIPSWQFVASHYDGIYYLVVGLDPFATDVAHTMADSPVYRYGHPGFGWLVGLLALGDVGNFPLAFTILEIGSLAAAAWAAARLAGRLGLTPWLGLTVALNPGLLIAVSMDTCEPFGTAVMFLALISWLERRWAIAAVLLVVLCFTKEHLLLVPVGLGLWEAAEWRRGRRAPHPARCAAALAIGPILYAGWVLYIRALLGALDTGPAPNLGQVPFLGWVDSILKAAEMSRRQFEPMQIGSASLPLQVAALGLLTIGMAAARRIRTPVDAVFLPSAALLLFLTWWVTLFPKDLERGLAFALALVPFVLMPQQGAPAGTIPGAPEVDLPRPDGQPERGG